MSGKLRLLLVALVVAAIAIWALGGNRYQSRDFVGKWQSSRTNTPIHLDANGEWEIRAEDGKVLQYGLWRYESGKLVWTIKQDDRVIDDPNPVLTVAPKEFQVKERDGSVTVFRRID